MESERVTVNVDAGSMPAFLCYPSDEGRHPAVIVIHEIHGLEAHIEDVACRFTTEGYAALAPDLYWNIGPLPEFTGRESYMRFRQSLDDQQLLASIDAAIAYLREQPGVDVAHIGIVGFCFGGYYALAEAIHNPSLAACVDFYGGGMNRLFEGVKQLRVPLLGLFGDEDQSIPPEQVRELRHTLQQAGVPFEIHTYRDAGHAFFNDTRPSYREHAAEDAWARTLQFYQKYLKG